MDVVELVSEGLFDFGRFLGMMLVGDQLAGVDKRAEDVVCSVD